MKRAHMHCATSSLNRQKLRAQSTKQVKYETSGFLHFSSFCGPDSPFVIENGKLIVIIIIIIEYNT